MDSLGLLSASQNGVALFWQTPFFVFMTKEELHVGSSVVARGRAINMLVTEKSAKANAEIKLLFPTSVSPRVCHPVCLLRVPNAHCAVLTSLSFLILFFTFNNHDSKE